MRHQYTPVFRDVLTSRVWAEPAATRAVWLWLKLSADPEGYVCGTLSGVALSARVTLDEARAALAFLESADADADPDDPAQGRILQKVPRGWLLLDHEEDRDRARHEADKARKRKWAAKARRAAANDQSPEPPEPTPVEPASMPAREAPTVDPTPEKVDAPKPKPKPKPTPKPSPSPNGDGDPPLPPGGFLAPLLPTVLREVPEAWQPSDELRAAAKTAGVERLDEHLAKLRRGPIGGHRGVFAHELESYIRDQFGRWRTWEETDRAKAPPSAPPGQSERARVAGMPAWVYAQHRDYAVSHGLVLKRAVASFARQAHVSPEAMRPADVFGPFMDYLKNLAQTDTRRNNSV